LSAADIYAYIVLGWTLSGSRPTSASWRRTPRWTPRA